MLVLVCIGRIVQKCGGGLDDRNANVFRTSDLRCRGMLALDNAVSISPSKRYEGQPSAGAYMEVRLGDVSQQASCSNVRRILVCHPHSIHGLDIKTLIAADGPRLCKHCRHLFSETNRTTDNYKSSMFDGATGGDTATERRPGGGAHLQGQPSRRRRQLACGFQGVQEQTAKQAPDFANDAHYIQKLHKWRARSRHRRAAGFTALPGCRGNLHACSKPSLAPTVLVSWVRTCGGSSRGRRRWRATPLWSRPRHRSQVGAAEPRMTMSSLRRLSNRYMCQNLSHHNASCIRPLVL